jgi:PAS domain S-box-containing protein
MSSQGRRNDPGADAVQGLRRFVDTVEHLADSFTEIDDAWSITYMNRTGFAWSGLTEHDVIGRNFWDLYPTAAGTPFGEALRRVMASRSAELFETTSSRSGRWFESNVFPSGSGIAVLSRDIDARKRDQAALLVADRRKDEFLATLGHELRNPLAPIRTAAQVLRRTTGNDPTARRATDIIERQVEQLTRLVDDLLDVSRITRGQVELRRRHIDLSTIIEQAVESTMPLLEARRHEVRRTLPAIPLPVHGDPARLGQVLSNLLHNAAKYTPEGGLVDVTVGRDQQMLEVRVSDNGQGLATEHQERVFELFTQIDRDRGYGGLGIGLTIARELVQRHGGSLHAESPGLGAGSTFVVRLPVDEDVDDRHADDAIAPIAMLPAPRRSLRRVVVVDDNRDAADALVASLGLTGHEVRAAYSGGSALDTARAFKPDVVLLDIGLPGMSGYDVARAIRNDPALSSVLLVAITGWGQPDDRRKAREAGFDHHRVKPVDTGDIEQLIAAAPDQDGRRAD